MYIVSELSCNKCILVATVIATNPMAGDYFLVFFLFIRSEVSEGLSLEMVVETCCLFDPEDKVTSLRDAGIHLQDLHGVSTEIHSRMPFSLPAGYTGYPRRNVPDFGRVFLMLKYTDITQNTYIQS